MTTIVALGDKLGEMQAELINRSAAIEQLRIDAETQHAIAIQALNTAFAQFNAALDGQMKALKDLIGE